MARGSGSSRYTVQALARALRLLGEFSPSEQRLPLGVLSARTGLARPTAFRLLSTMEEAGFVVKEGSDYRLGFKCFVLGNVAAEGLDLRRVAHPHLEALRDATGETTQIAILDNWLVVYLDRVSSLQPVAYMTSRVGSIVQAHCTSLGKVLLAFRPEDDVAAWAATETFRAYTPNTITSVDRLLEELRATRERGYALDEQERQVGVRCIGAPIRDHEGEVVAAISIAAPGERMPRSLIGSQMAAHVIAAARQISRHLGAADEKSFGPSSKEDLGQG